MKPALFLVLAVGTAVLTSVALQACSNSILRNAAEAGIETVLEGPLPTPTPRAAKPRADHG